MVCLIAALLLNESLWGENSKCIVRLMGENSWQMTLVCFRNLRRCYYAKSGELCETRSEAAEGPALGSDVPEVPEGLGENLLGHSTHLDLTEAGISHH